MSSSHILHSVVDRLDEQSIFCFMDNHVEQKCLKKVNYESESFVLDDDTYINFDKVRFLIIRNPIYDSLVEYLAKVEHAGVEPHYFKFKFTYSDEVARDGNCVKCELANGLWHIYRYHQGHIYYILIPHLHVKKHKLTEVKIPGANSKQIFDQYASAEKLNYDLSKVQLDQALVSLFTPEILNRLKAVPLYVQHGNLVVAMADPTKLEDVQLLSFISGKTIEPVVAPVNQISKSLSRWTHDKNELDALDELQEKGAIQKQLSSIEIENLGKQKGIIRLMHSIIQEAIERGVSDIHLHPRKQFFELLYRIDGNLVSIRKLNASLHQALISRIKILGKMDISEHRLPQDGRVELKQDDSCVDMRISIMPTIFGESAVIRILDSSKGLMSLDELGFNAKDTQTLEHLLHASYGMILVTGPTGSGKSTTLYAAIQELVKRGPHIITVEEPVEYQMDGVTQIPVNHKTGYTFARALRNILRHDPDIVMVGEIRDGETAKIAVESALTGHLVLSTLHTNSAPSTITRLLEIGVQPYLLKDALIGVIAQRLVRKICPKCKTEDTVSSAIRSAIGANEEDVFYSGKGCKHCHNTGVKGRKSVYELLTLSQEIKMAISNNKSANDLETIALEQGMIPLGVHALSLAKQGIISAEEAYKVRAN